MIEAIWLIMMLPAFFVGALVGEAYSYHVFYTKASLARDAVKRAEAYEAYKKAISGLGKEENQEHHRGG